MRSKYTRSPAGSTIATAIVQPFLRASARAGTAIFFAASSVTGGPYGLDICCADAAAAQQANARIVRKRESDWRESDWRDIDATSLKGRRILPRLRKWRGQI